MKALIGSTAVALVLSAGLAYGQAATDRKDHEMGSPNGEMQQQQRPVSDNESGKADESKKLTQQERAQNPASKSAEQTNKAEDQRGTANKKAAAEKNADPNKAAAESSQKPSGMNRNEAQKPSDKNNMNAQRADDPQTKSGRSATANSRASGSVSIDAQKQTRIQDALRNQHVENINHADFDIRVGVSVPDHYHFNPLPEDVVALVPEYRGYDYIMVDNEIVIIEPSTHKIVYTMQEGRSSARDGRPVDCK